MIKKLAKLFMPSAATLSGLAADGIAEAVNKSKAETRDKIAKIAAVATEATDIAARLSRMVEDGEINTAESAALAAMLEPVFASLLKLI